MSDEQFDKKGLATLAQSLLIVHQGAALQQWAEQFRRMPGGLEFLQAWARQWRLQGAVAVLPKYDAATSDLLASEQEDVIEVILKNLAL